MKTNQTLDLNQNAQVVSLKQYARVARVIPRTSQNTTNAKVRVVVTSNNQI